MRRAVALLGATFWVFVGGCQPITAPATPTATLAPTPTVAGAVPVDVPRTQVLVAADDAFQRGAPAAADELYRRVLGTPPRPGETRATQDAVEQYARYREVLSQLLLGREDQARSQLRQLEERLPDAPFTRLAAQLWEQYGMTADVRAACASVQAQVEQVRPVLEVLGQAGVVVDAATVCRAG